MAKTPQTPEGSTLMINIKGSDGRLHSFKVRSTTKFSKIFAAFCKKTAMPQRGLVFLYDGNRVDENHTPEGLEMKENDHVDVMQHQTGGSS